MASSLLGFWLANLHTFLLNFSRAGSLARLRASLIAFVLAGWRACLFACSLLAELASSIVDSDVVLILDTCVFYDRQHIAVPQKLFALVLPL